MEALAKAIISGLANIQNWDDQTLENTKVKLVQYRHYEAGAVILEWQRQKEKKVLVSDVIKICDKHFLPDAYQVSERIKEDILKL